MPLIALAGPPVKLVPTHHPGTPTVSNTGKVANRILIKSLKLELRVGSYNCHSENCTKFSLKNQNFSENLRKLFSFFEKKIVFVFALNLLVFVYKRMCPI